MFIQSTLSEKSTRTNRRAAQDKRNTGGSFRSGKKRAVSGRTVTGGRTPRYGTRITEEKTGITLPSITPWKVILTSFLIGICGILYITHVFSTQQTLQKVRQLENEYNRISRVHTERRLEYDRLTGPKEIYQNAREQGFINAGPADQVIFLKK